MTFAPARSKSDMKWIINQAHRINNIDDKEFTVDCFEEQTKTITSTSTVDSSQPKWMRQANLIRNSAGGQVNWGDERTPRIVNYLGRGEGQKGGSQTPIRNIF